MLTTSLILPNPSALAKYRVSSAISLAASKGASLKHAVEIAEKRIEAKPSMKAAQAHYDKFNVFRQLHHLTMGFVAVAMFLTQFKDNNKGHTTSLGAVLSHLRTQHERKGLPFLSTQEDTRVKQLIAHYRKEDPSTVRRAYPLRTAIALRIIGTMDLTDPAQLTRATQLLTAVQGLLRAGEATNHLHAGDFIFKTNEKSVVIHIPPTKTCKTGEGVWVEIADNNSSITAYKLLVRLFAMRDLLKKPSEMVFCMIRQGRLYPEKRSSKDAFGELIKSSVAAIGLDRTLYSGHSCRAGGATDLFAAGVPYYVVKRYGRWTSDAALIYYRCESSIARAASKAFEV